MSALREEIRAILREELLALRAQAPTHSIEAVQIASDSDLNRFARNLVSRASEPGFAERVANGELSFTLSAPPASHHNQTSAARPSGVDIDKALITERDIAAIDGRIRSLRVRKHARLTPLARDEARRLGIRIERTA